MANATSPSDQQQFDDLLKKLSSLIKKLPTTLPCGTKDGPIALNFSDLGHDSEDCEEGPYYTFNRSWERVFQCSDAQKELLVIRGKYGLDLALAYIMHFSKVPGIEQSGGLVLLGARIESLIDLIETVKNKSVSKMTTRPTNATKSSGSGKRVRDSGSDSDADTNDDAYKPKNPPAATSTGDSEAGAFTDEDSASGTGKRAEQDAKSEKSKKPKKKKAKTPIYVSDTDVTVEDVQDAKPGCNPVRSQWAFSLWTPRPAINKGKPVWKWSCNFCSKYRCTPRTEGCTKYENEKMKRPGSSNFISHSQNCKYVPARLTWAAYERASGAGSITTDTNDAEANSGVGLTGTAALTGLEAQRSFMDGFSARGLQNPAKTVTSKGFREYLVKGLIEDDLPYSLGEKAGMRKLFGYLLPRGIACPSHQTVRRDLNVLYDKVNEKLNHTLQSNTSKLAIASDLWTSKNSVYAFVGTVVFWIDENWNLNECVIELLPLSGDHSGKASGKLIFKALRQRKIEKKLSANGADNASSNGPLNRTLSKCLRKASNFHIDAANMQIGCGGHVLNICCQAIYYGLGCADDPDVDDYYNKSRGFPNTYSPDEDPDVVEEMKIAEAELKRGSGDGTDDDADDANQESSSDGSTDDEGGDSGEDNENDWADEDDEMRDQGLDQSEKRKQKQKVLSCVDKLHAIVVDILRSEVKRKKMRQLIRNVCAPKNRHLVPIRSMKIRWNTTYAEILRGIDLKPAINQWIDALDQYVTGKARTVARRRQRKWRISPDEWETLEKLCGVLKVFQDATLELSQTKTPTISKVLPLFKMIQQHLRRALSDPDLVRDKSGMKYRGLKTALNCGLSKIDIYLEKALISDYPLLGAVLHPSIRLSYFEDASKWDGSIASRARFLLEHLYKVHEEESPVLESSVPKPPIAASIFLDAVRNASPHTQPKPAITELEAYFSGTNPCFDGDALKWWKTHSTNYPVLARIARDVLAIPGVSISVERLFSSSKHTLSDTRSSLSAVSASKTVVVKEWLKKGFGENVNYLDGARILS